MSVKKQNLTKSYTLGFIVALILTNAAFVIVQSNSIDGWMLVAALAGLAIIQLWVQLHFFLHLGRESKPRWNLLMFLFAVIVVVILVFGSLWIMNNLGYHGMPATSSDAEIMQEEGIYKESQQEGVINE